MTTVEEDLLLNEPAATEYDCSAILDEDLLLGAGDVSSRKATLESIDDSSLLLEDSVEHASEQDPEQVPDDHDNEKTNNDREDVESDKEELDYDEEEEDEDGRRERTSRYTSEKKRGSRLTSEEGDENNQTGGKGKRNNGIPSLFDKTITNNPLKSGDQPIGVVLRIEGEAERIFYPPPSFMANEMQQPIVPRLPNGIPLIAMPANHGRAGFGAGYQQQGRMAGGGGMPVMGGQWDNEVAKFLSGAPISSSHRVRNGKKRRSSSYSSASSYSSDSRSRSRSSSRGRRRDDKRRRRNDDRREVKSYVRRDERRDDRRDDRDRRRHDDRRSKDRSRERDSYHSERDSRKRKEQSRNATIESAKALGLSNDYMDQVYEQKRKREEIVRKKEERRHGSDKKENSSSGPISSISASTSSSASGGREKMKAYLAVNVCGVQQLPTAVKKIEALAVDLGPIKKCWRSAEDVVSIIFNAHDKAKDFMIKYNGKVLSGLRITVSLEKKFLNLNEVN